MPRWPDKNRHSCYILKYHLILVTNYRNPVITGIVKEDLIDLIKSIAGIKWGCNIIAINTEEDHVHVLFSAPPQVRLSDLVNSIKTCTSRELRKRHAEFLSRYYWKPLFWSDSYYIGSVGDTTEEIVTLYIESQSKKQKKNAANPAQV